MTDIFKVVEEILNSPSSDLRELAELAGYEPEVMYFGADLSGADMRTQNVNFLIGLEADYDHAILTADQRTLLALNDTRTIDRSKVWRSIANVRLMIVRGFIMAVEADPKNYVVPVVGASQILEKALLDPLLDNQRLSPGLQCGRDYIGGSISILASAGDFSFTWAFFLELFELFGKIQCRGSLATVMIFDQILAKKFNDGDVASLIIASSPSPLLVEYWVNSPKTKSKRRRRAILLAKRMVIPVMITQSIFENFESTSSLMSFLALPNVESDRSIQTTLADKIMKSDRRWEALAEALSSGLTDRFKYLLACRGLSSGDRESVELCSKYLGRISHGFGGMLLEDALLNFPDFDIALKSAARLLHIVEEGSFKKTIVNTMLARVVSQSQRTDLARMLRNELAPELRKELEI